MLDPSSSIRSTKVPGNPSLLDPRYIICETLFRALKLECSLPNLPSLCSFYAIWPFKIAIDTVSIDLAISPLCPHHCSPHRSFKNVGTQDLPFPHHFDGPCRNWTETSLADWDYREDHQLGGPERQIGRIQTRAVGIQELYLERAGSRVPAREGQIPSLCQLCLSVGYVKPIEMSGLAPSKRRTETLIRSSDSTPNSHRPEAERLRGYHTIHKRALAHAGKG